MTPARPQRCRPGTGRPRAGGRSAVRCPAGIRCRISARSRTSTGGITGSKPSPIELLHHVAHQRELDHHQVAAQIHETASRTARRRVPCRSSSRPAPGDRRPHAPTRRPHAGPCRPAARRPPARSAAPAAAASSSARTEVSLSVSSRPRAASAAICSRSSGVGAPVAALVEAVLLGPQLLELGRQPAPLGVQLEHARIASAATSPRRASAAATASGSLLISLISSMPVAH